jgi:hypothetical protein
MRAEDGRSMFLRNIRIYLRRYSPEDQAVRTLYFIQERTFTYGFN